MKEITIELPTQEYNNLDIREGSTLFLHFPKEHVIEYPKMVEETI